MLVSGGRFAGAVGGVGGLGGAVGVEEAGGLVLDEVRGGGAGAVGGFGRVGGLGEGAAAGRRGFGESAGRG